MKKIKIVKPKPEEVVIKLREAVYEVGSFTNIDKRYTIDLVKKTCTCIAWEMGRRPCKHQIYLERILTPSKA